jgi:hypothetical protein
VSSGMVFCMASHMCQAINESFFAFRWFCVAHSVFFFFCVGGRETFIAVIGNTIELYIEMEMTSPRAAAALGCHM